MTYFSEHRRKREAQTCERAKRASLWANVSRLQPPALTHRVILIKGDPETWTPRVSTKPTARYYRGAV